MANVNVIPDGREKIAVCDMMNAKLLIVMAMDSVPTASVCVFEDLKENSAKKVKFVIFLIIYRSFRSNFYYRLIKLYLVDCPHPTCNGHGICLDGTCVCKKGWKGLDCSQADKDALQCLPDCSGHGKFDIEAQTCNCDPLWSGEDCSRG